MNPVALRQLLERALEVVRETDRMILEQYAGSRSVMRKPDRSFVTDLDVAIERHMRERLLRAGEGIGFLGEESGITEGESGLEWVADPIDGTHSLRSRIPLFGTLLALRERGEPVLGVVSLPLLGTLYWATRGGGAWRNGKRLRLDDFGPGDDLSDEIIATGERRQFVRAGKAREFDRFLTRHPGVRTYCDCFGHGLAFEGAVAAMVDFDVRIWDCAASRVVIEEAGGVFHVVERRSIDGEDHFDVILGRRGAVETIAGLFERDSKKKG